MVDLDFDDESAAEVFLSAPRDLWGRVGGDLGVEGPRARILDVVESREY